MERSRQENNLPSNRKKAIDELVQGRELANQLRQFLNRTGGNGGGSAAPAEDLVAKILKTFTNSLSILNSNESDHEVCQIQHNAFSSSQCWNRPKSESSEESCRSSNLRDRRGCYKRRKTTDSVSRETPTLVDDGYAWRKYGQKVILNAKHPRHYYRCTHKLDQGCLATKQVQRIQDDPPKYRTTFCGHHTCKNFLRAPELILDPAPNDSSILLSFDNNNNVKNNINNIKNKQDNNNPIFSSFPSIKQELKEEIPSDLHMSHNQSSSSDYLLSPDDHDTAFESFESFGHMSVLSSTLESDRVDVISGVMVGSVNDFDDVFQFEF